MGDVQCNNTIMLPKSGRSVRSIYLYLQRVCKKEHRITVRGAEQGRIEYREEETGCLI